MSTKFTCRFCKEQFDAPKGLYKHLQLVHNAGISRDNCTCPICGVICSKYESYRDHLLYIHGQTDEGQKLTFKSLNEFLVWKAELELKYSCKYVLQTSPKVLPTKEKKYFYQCDRSDSKSKDKKSVVMKTCSSVISVVEGIGIFKVEYWDTHSGHKEVLSSPSVQSELEAAISSVEMVNAIGDSDDSFDRSDELLIPENSTPSSHDKQSFIIKPNSPKNNLNSPVINTFQKTGQSLGKSDTAKKKTNNSSVLFSLASVACGKGILKKPANKLKENKNVDSDSSSKPEIKTYSKTIAGVSSDTSTVKHKNDPSSQKATSAAKLKEPIITSTTSISASSTASTKTTPSTPLAIAPKITAAPNSTINPLFTTNSTFSNQFVIMNPVSMDQNSLNSSPVLTTGQNIVFSLGPVGQNIPPNSISQTTNQASGTEEKKPGCKTKASNGETSSKANTSNTVTAVKNSVVGTPCVSKSIINTMTSSAPSNSALTLTPGLNNAPVILSSLPVGSTFMSVNNNLIPIASPSGAFIPTSLPPNIVLTPVVPGTSNMDISNTTISSTNAPSSAPKNAQTSTQYTTSSTVAITVSSIVKEPVYTSSAIKHGSNIVTSSTPSPVSSTSTPKGSRQKTVNKFVPITTAGRVSPSKSVYKPPTSSSKGPNASKSKNSFNTVANKAEINVANKNLSKMKALPVISTVVINATSSKTARKRISRSIKSKPVINPVVSSNDSASFNTKVVNSRLHLTPISSTPNVTVKPEANVQKPGTMLFESSAGDIYMLEPVENEEDNSAPSKHLPSTETPKIKIDRSMQTNESSNLGGFRLPLKRAAPPSDDSAVLLKVKCYQLEMKYLNSQTECKRLKVELTKERLKNAHLTGKKPSINLEDELNEASSTNAAEIMKEIEDKFSESKDVNIYTMTKTSVLRSLYEDIEELCIENNQLYKELESYRSHDKFYKNLKKKLYDEEF